MSLHSVSECLQICIQSYLSPFNKIKINRYTVPLCNLLSSQSLDILLPVDKDTCCLLFIIISQAWYHCTGLSKLYTHSTRIAETSIWLRNRILDDHWSLVFPVLRDGLFYSSHEVNTGLSRVSMVPATKNFSILIKIDEVDQQPLHAKQTKQDGCQHTLACLRGKTLRSHPAEPFNPH